LENKIVYICGSYENTERTLRTYVTDIDSAETEQLPLPDDRIWGCGMAWSPDGEAIAYNTDSGIHILSLETIPSPIKPL